jgi:RNA polymerase sigma-70 factor (ECF subfamily)
VLSLELRDLKRAIALLYEEQRQVVLLVGLDGMRYEKVASVLDIPIGTVRSRLSRGRHALRRMMEGRQRMMPRDRYGSGVDRQAA